MSQMISTAGRSKIYALLCAMLLIVPTMCYPLDSSGGQTSHPLGLSTGAESADAAVHDETADLALWPHEKSDLPPDPALVFGKLPNGFRYVLMRNQTPRNRVSMHLNIQAGSLQEQENQQGLAHFLEHLMFNGTRNFPPGELVKYFQSIGMQFGPDANAHTGFDETVYDVLLPDGSAQSIRDGLTVLRDFADGALLLESEIERERRVILAEKRARDSAGYRTYVATSEFEFAGTRLPRRFPIGQVAVIENADRNVLQAYYDTWYRPDKMAVVMVGDFNVQQAEGILAQKFSSLRARAAAAATPALGELSNAGTRSFYHFEKESGNTRVQIGIVERIEDQPDSAAFQKNRMIQYTADRIVQDRLDVLARKPDTPFTSAYIRSGIFLRQLRFAEIAAESSPEKWSQAMALIEQVLRQALTFGFTAAELERVKKDLQADLEREVQQAATRKSSHLARQITANLNAERVFQSPAQELKLFAPLVQSLTRETVHAALQNTWRERHRYVMVTGNLDLAGQDRPPAEVVRRVFEQSLAQAVFPPQALAAVSFPNFPEPETRGRVAQRREFADLGIVQVDFDNGIRLNLKPTDFAANEVQMTLAFGNGRSGEPRALAGLAELAEAIVNESGLGSLDREQLQRALAGRNADVGFRVDEDRFIFKGQSVSSEIRLLFQLMFAHIRDPGFRPEAFTRVMERFDQTYQELSRSVDGSLKLQGTRFLAGGDTRFGLPPHDVFRSLTLAEVRSWIGEPLQQDRLELSVVGDFDVPGVVELAAHYLGSLAPRAGSPPLGRPAGPVFPTGQSQGLEVVTDIPKGLVVVAYPTDDFWDIQRTRRLSLLAEVFSDRLRLSVREKLGAAYSPFAYNRGSRAYPGYGLLQAFVYVNPAEAGVVEREIRTISTQLVENGITPDELQRAKDPVLTELKDMVRTNAYWLNSVLTGALRHAQQLEWARSLQSDYAAIREDELSALARRYLDNTQAATLVIRPAQP